MNTQRHIVRIPTLSVALPLLLLLCMLGIALVGQPQTVLAGDNGGSSLNFDGTDDYVDLGSSSTLKPDTALTVEVWAYRSNWAAANEDIVGNQQGAGYAIETKDGDEVHFELYSGGSWQTAGIPVAGLSAGWHHFAGTFDGRYVRLYVDGVLEATGDMGSSGNTINYINNHTFIGAEAGDAGAGSTPETCCYYTGTLDDVRIWDITRTVTEIRDNMFKELAGTESGLVAYYKMNSGSGDTLTDSAGSNDGALGSTAGSDTNDPSWQTSTAPFGSLTHTIEPAGLWGAQPDTAGDAQSTGLDIADNATNSFLNDIGDDIIFSHDGASFANVTTNLGSSSAEKRWARVWELDVNDASGTSGGDVDLTFDISDAGGKGSFDSNGTYYLLKRATGTSNDFTEVNYTSASVSGDKLTFSGVSVGDLGSEFTLGATSNSPTAITIRRLSAQSGETQHGAAIGIAALLALGIVGPALGRRRRSDQSTN